MKKLLFSYTGIIALVLVISGCNSGSRGESSPTDGTVEYTTSHTDSTEPTTRDYIQASSLSRNDLLLVTVDEGTPVYREYFNKASESNEPSESEILFYTQESQTFLLKTSDFCLNNFGKLSGATIPYNTPNGVIYGTVMDFNAKVLEGSYSLVPVD